MRPSLMYGVERVGGKLFYASLVRNSASARKRTAPTTDCSTSGSRIALLPPEHDRYKLLSS